MDGAIPVARSGHRAVAIGGNLYIIGGYVQFNSGMKVLGEIWEFNLISRRWRLLDIPNCPFHLALSADVVVLSNRFIIHGGTGYPFGESVDNSLIEVNVETEQCRVLPCRLKDDDVKNMPALTYGHTLTHVHLPEDGGKDFLYKVAGSVGAPFVNIISAYDFETGAWETVSPDEPNDYFLPR